MTTVTRPVVKALLDRQRQYSTDPDDVGALLDAALSGQRPRGAFLYV